jgi:exonuclease V gamma subunit
VLTGTLTQRFGSDIVHHQFARVRARHLLRLWLTHLAHCLVRPTEQTPKALLLGRPEAPADRAKAETERAVERRCFRAVADPARELSRLIELYDEGQCLPLAFFPTASLVFVQSLQEKADQRAAREAAGKAWLGDAKYDAHVARVFGNETPSFAVRGSAEAAAFEALAEVVYAPLLAHLESP